MLSVKKRDGKIVEFDIHKIENAIAKAFEAVNKSYNIDIIFKEGVLYDERYCLGHF